MSEWNGICYCERDTGGAVRHRSTCPLVNLPAAAPQPLAMSVRDLTQDEEAVVLSALRKSVSIVPTAAPQPQADKDADKPAVMLPLSEINMALARGYCSPANARKEVDADLIDAMALEVQKMLIAAVLADRERR